MKNYYTNFYENIDFLQVTIILFTACNLNCKFCFQNHTNDIDYNNIILIHQQLSKAILHKLQNNNKIKQVTLHFMGGQVFMDSISDQIFNAYKKLYFSIYNDIKNFNNKINVSTTWLSNGVFTNKNRVQLFLNQTNTSISFSYDPIDRFASDKQKQLMLSNLYYFKQKNLLSVLSITITKKSISYYISNNELIEFQNNGIDYIDISLYSPNIGYQNYIFSDQDLYNFFKYIIDNKIYSIKFVNRFLQQLTGKQIPLLRQCICKNNLGYYKNNISYDCVKRSSCFPKQYFYGKYSNEVTENNCNELALQIGLNKRGCIYCQWHDKCVMPCWTSYIFKYNYQNGICPYKRTFQYISKNQHYIQEFKNDYLEKQRR